MQLTVGLLPTDGDCCAQEEDFLQTSPAAGSSGGLRLDIIQAGSEDVVHGPWSVSHLLQRACGVIMMVMMIVWGPTHMQISCLPRNKECIRDHTRDCQQRSQRNVGWVQHRALWGAQPEQNDPYVALA